MICHGLNIIFSDFFFNLGLYCVFQIYMYVYSRSKGKGRKDGALSHGNWGEIINW